METPQHVHDCDNCTFLGRFVNEDIVGNYDLYYCLQGGSIPTLIARWGKAERCMSGMIFGFKNREDMQCPLGEAWRRAKEKGLKVQRDCWD
jgi:hypothetical protein